MSENMVERVARAIALADLDPETRAAVDPDVWFVAESYYDLARAAIEAMRDASFGMVGAGQIAVNLADDDESPMYLGRHEVEEIWEEMIDAALKD